MRFGAFVPQGWRLDLVDVDREEEWPTMLSIAKTIEASGFESLWVFDHFHTVPQPTQEVTYEAWTLMAALAAATDTVRLGQMCTCNSYRPPSYLAKVAATIDVISGGRLEMGIGAGWYDHEYAGYGYEFPKASVRIGMLREGVEIMKAMWTQDEVHYDGTYYTLDGAINQPKPLQKPHIPFWIAGGGEKLTLRIAAEYADYTNFAGDPAAFARKSEILRGHCTDAGTDYDRIVRSRVFHVICEETEAEVEERLRWREASLRRFVSEDQARGEIEWIRPTSGTPEQLVELLTDFAKVGMSYAIIFFPDAGDSTAGMERFAREVMPALADA